MDNPVIKNQHKLQNMELSYYFGKEKQSKLDGKTTSCRPHSNDNGATTSCPKNFWGDKLVETANLAVSKVKVNKPLKTFRG